MTAQNVQSASQLAAHVPLDRLLALRAATDLPRHAEGSVLFADLSGFTPLTELLMRTFGARRGAEELTQLLDLVYEQIIACVHRFGGSVIGFSGDAITCWFPSPDGLVATACGLEMQRAMAPFAAYPLAADQSISLRLKVAIAGGPVQRFLVGDPAIQLIDILAGVPLGWLSALEKQARSGEVIVDRRLAAQLGPRLAVAEWRAAGELEGAIVTAVSQPPPDAAPALPAALPDNIDHWVAPTVLARLQDQNQAFLTELRPTIALFLSFSGPDEYDLAAQAELDAYIRWVQHILLRYEATLIQLTPGEKGNYLYASFGAPLAHEDDAIRAVRAALELRHSPHAVRTERIGIAQGIARTGVYGSSTRRTYGVLGDAVNLAARLMQAAGSDQILASDQVWSATQAQFHWDPLPPLTVKGKQAPLLVASLGGPIAEPARPALGALVGRAAEHAAMQDRLRRVQQGAGQVILVTGEAGIGKSRLVREAPQMLGAQDIVLSGATQSYAVNSPYLCWVPIWQAIFAVAPADPLAANLGRVAAALDRLAPRLQPQLPLLASVLNLPIPENDLTRTLDAQGRKERLETLLVTCLGAYARELAAAGRSLLLILEDLHWIDALSADLLRQIAPLLAALPAGLVVTSRQVAEAAPLLAALAELPHASAFALAELSPAAVSALLGARLPAEDGGAAQPDRARLIEQIHARANGNPFYVEELISYLVTSDTPIDERYGWQQLDLPTGLHRLVLSRIDRLGERQQRVLKTASVLGGSFPQRWLWESYPALGDAAQVRADLAELQRSDLLGVADDPELCRFKHAITREVTYESLGRSTRAQLHEQCAAYLEQARPDGEEPLDLLAYHYEQSRNDEKAVVYLARNAERAMRLFANQAAADQYQRAIRRAGNQRGLPPAALERGLGEVYAQMAEFDQALASYAQALADLPPDAVLERGAIAILQADVLVRATRFEEAVALIEATEADLRGLAPEGRPLPADARVLLARLAELRSIKSQRQADRQAALDWAEHGLAQIARLPASLAEVAPTRIRLYQAAAAAAINLSDYPRARRMLRNAFRLVKTYPHPVIEAELQLRQALVLQRAEALLPAIRRFEAVLPRMEATGTRDRLAYVLVAGSQAILLHGAYARAEEWLARALDLAKEVNSAFLMCTSISVLCLLYTYTGRWDSVLKYSSEGRELAERHELHSWHAQFLFNEGEMRLYRGEFEQATDVFNHLSTYAGQFSVYAALSQRYLAYGAFMQGQINQALEYMHGSRVEDSMVTSSTQAFDVLGIAEWWVLLRSSEIPLPHDESALRAAVTNSISFWLRRGYRSNLPYAWRVLAMLEWQSDQQDAAFTAIQRGLTTAQRIGHVPEHARCLFWRAKLFFAFNMIDKGMDDLAEAGRIFATLGAWPEHSRTQRLARAPQERGVVL